MTDRNRAYTELLMRHREMLWRMCRKHTGGDRDRCQDMLQEVSIALWEHFDKLHPGASSGEEQAWVYWQARSVFYQIERRHKLSTMPIADAVADGLADEETQHRKELIDELLASLTPDEQQMVRLYLEGYQGGEIGAKMGVSRDTVYKRMQRVVQKLRKLALVLLALLFTSAIAVAVVPQWRQFFFGIRHTEPATDTVPASKEPAAPMPDTVPAADVTVKKPRFKPPLERMPPLDLYDLDDTPPVLHPVTVRDKLAITVSGSTLFITGAEGESVRVYDISGNLVAARTATAFCFIDLFPNVRVFSPFRQYEFILRIGSRPAMKIRL